MSNAVIGLDIGGANLKAALGDGTCRTRPFALWKAPEQLAAELRKLLDGWSGVRIALTMTGELCDCFETKRQGVRAILDAVAQVVDQRAIKVWTTAGCFVDFERARNEKLPCAAANWLALATFAGRFALHGSGLLVDIGSTTTDIVPLRDGVPVPQGRTDSERLATGELVYSGVRRTPICAIHLPKPIMAEFFATTLDVDLVLGRQQENGNDLDTADGRPATRKYALARLARMIGGDGEVTPEDEVVRLAEEILRTQKRELADSILRQQVSIDTAVISGAGERLALEALSLAAIASTKRIVSLSGVLGKNVSASACAHAVAVLSAEGNHGP